MKRLFVAIDIQLNADNMQCVELMRRATPNDDIVWVQQELYHCTLRFLGKTPNHLIEPIAQRLEQVAQLYAPFSLTCDRFGFFGSSYAPKVIWLGFQEELLVKQLFQDIEREMVALGEFAESTGNFVPHTTLGRVKRVDNKKRFWKTMEQFQPAAQTFQIREIVLYRSQLERTGPIYTALRRFPLGASNG